MHLPPRRRKPLQVAPRLRFEKIQRVVSIQLEGWAHETHRVKSYIYSRYFDVALLFPLLFHLMFRETGFCAYFKTCFIYFYHQFCCMSQFPSFLFRGTVTNRQLDATHKIVQYNVKNYLTASHRLYQPGYTDKCRATLAFFITRYHI